MVEIKVKRVNDEIEYIVNCSKGVTSDELAHYLDEIIGGICTWKPEVCEENVETIVGKIKNPSKRK